MAAAFAGDQLIDGLVHVAFTLHIGHDVDVAEDKIRVCGDELCYIRSRARVVQKLKSMAMFLFWFHLDLLSLIRTASSLSLLHPAAS